MVFAAVLSTAGMAAERVDLSDKVKWTCEGDTKVSLDQKTGILRIRSKAAKVDQILPFRSCHSSHCDWGLSPSAAECGEVPCAEIVAGPDNQSLMINLTDFEKTCQAKKP